MTNLVRVFVGRDFQNDQRQTTATQAHSASPSNGLVIASNPAPIPIAMPAAAEGLLSVRNIPPSTSEPPSRGTHPPQKLQFHQSTWAFRNARIEPASAHVGLNKARNIQNSAAIANAVE